MTNWFKNRIKYMSREIQGEKVFRGFVKDNSHRKLQPAYGYAYLYRDCPHRKMQEKIDKAIALGATAGVLYNDSRFLSLAQGSLSYGNEMHGQHVSDHIFPRQVC